MTTSLQLALSKQGTSGGVSSSNERLDKKKGAFETCFAGSLDLSEFADNDGKTADSALPRRSAAAELLKVKAQEREIREREQHEEEKMGSIVQQRAQSLKESMVKRQQQRLLGRNSSQSVVTSALLSMHQSDHNQLSGRSHNKRKQKLAKSKPLQRSNIPKSKAIKKSKRSKY